MIVFEKSCKLCCTEIVGNSEAKREKRKKMQRKCGIFRFQRLMILARRQRFFFPRMHGTIEIGVIAIQKIVNISILNCNIPQMSSTEMRKLFDDRSSKTYQLQITTYYTLQQQLITTKSLTNFKRNISKVYRLITKMSDGSM